MKAIDYELHQRSHAHRTAERQNLRTWALDFVEVARVELDPNTFDRLTELADARTPEGAAA